MTTNQIAYWSLIETVRANKAREALTGQQNTEAARHNLASEHISTVSNQLTERSVAENERANRAREWANFLNYQEMARANAEKERQNLISLTENERSNRAREQLTQQAQQESQRHNLVSEAQGSRNLDLGFATLAETQRTHLANESIGLLNAYAAQLNAQSQSRAVSESARHNLQVEQETARSNRAREDLTKQSNIIAQKNQVANMRQALASERQASAATLNASANLQNAQSNALNASANLQNAEANATRANAQMMSVLLAGEQFEWSKGMDVANTILKGAEVVLSSGGGAMASTLLGGVL